MSRGRRLLAKLGRRAMRRTGYAIIWRNPRGYSLATHLMAVFAHLDVNCVLDVGAHFGEYGSMLRRYGYRGRIVSFEPVAESFERLGEARRRDPGWLAYHAAVGAEDGEAEINVSSDSALSSFLPAGAPVTPKEGAAIALAGRQRVRICRLDSVFDECVAGLDEPRVFLKMDTQGWDGEVLRGADESLPRILGLQSEVSVVPLYEGMTPYLDAIRQLEQLDFDLTGVYPVAHAGFRVVELDVVLARATS